MEEIESITTGTYHENDRITDGLDIFFWVFDDERSYVSTHWHSAIEVMYIMDGQVNIAIDGKTTTLVKDDIFLVDSAVAHSTKSLHGNYAVLIQFPYPLLKRYIPDIDSLRFSFDCHSGDPEEMRKQEELKKITKKMKKVFETNPDMGILKFNSLVFEFLYVMHKNFARQMPAAEGKKEEKTFKRITQVLDYLEKNYNKQISLEEIASVACFQKEYFCHFFKKNMGISYSKYLNELRISHIYKDLSETNIPLKDLLEIHGFTNYKLFRSMFYEEFHTTPGEYRKKLQENN
ncbi:MAG: AraC family transcriptional regulator [Pseudobutyrivibrio sp.]|nr:AraC family transcriptional regulator [Pseudobutyrivibrio sp.]